VLDEIKVEAFRDFWGIDMGSKHLVEPVHNTHTKDTRASAYAFQHLDALELLDMEGLEIRPKQVRERK
jgi:hypothetical protein